MTWHYQLMKHTETNGKVWYAVHEFYGINTYTKFPVHVKGVDEEGIVRMLEHILSDIEKHGVKDYE